MNREDEVMRIVREAAGDDQKFMSGLAELARRDVHEALDALRVVDSGTGYDELARLGRRLASAAGLVAEEGIGR